MEKRQASKEHEREAKVFIKLLSSRCFRLTAPVIIKNINNIAKYKFSRKLLLYAMEIFLSQLLSYALFNI